MGARRAVAVGLEQPASSATLLAVADRNPLRGWPDETRVVKDGSHGRLDPRVEKRKRPARLDINVAIH